MVQPGIAPRYTIDSTRPGEKRMAGFGWLPNRTRHLLIAFIGEFVGTFLFLFFAFAATQVANNLLAGQSMDIQTLMYISLAFGFSLAVNVWIFFRISGGLFNPAVTVAMALIGAMGWINAVLLILAQLCGAIAAAGVVSALFPGPLVVRTTLSPETSTVRGLFIEMFLTAQLVFCIFMLAAEKHRSTFIAPIGIGLALFIAELAGVYFTGGSLNPARSFGPDVVLARFDGYHWVYWVGPLLGAVLAVVFYRLIKALEYESAIPNADSDGCHDTYKRSNSYDQEANGVPTRGTGAVDGTSESMDFASRIRNPQAARPPAPQRSYNSNFVAMSDIMENSSSRFPELRHGGDGHQSDSASDDSYRNGPGAETGSS